MSFYQRVLILYISPICLITCREGEVYNPAKRGRARIMTEGKRGNGTDMGKRFYDIFVRMEQDRSMGPGKGLDTLHELASTAGMTHEEALLLLASPDDMEEVIRKKGTSVKELSSLNRLLDWSDRQRRLQVMGRADGAAEAEEAMRCGAQGIGLVRGEAVFFSAPRVSELYRAWLDSDDGAMRLHFRNRLISMLSEEWLLMLQAAGGSLISVSLAWDAAEKCSPETRLELQDIQLESLFRAALGCQSSGTECRLEILALWPGNSADYTAAYDFIEEVGGQTLGLAKREMNVRIGALLHPDLPENHAADIARLSDVIVIDIESTSKLHLLRDFEPLTGRFKRNRWEGPVTEWASPALIHAQIEETVRNIREVKPNIDIRAGGRVGPADLAAVYRLGFSEVCCSPEQLAAVRLTGARMELESTNYKMS